MVVIGIVGVLAALAAPSFTNMRERFLVNAGLDDLSNAIQLARSEAVRTRGQGVVAANTGCAAGGWSCGVTVFADLNGNGTQDGNEPTAKLTEEHTGLTITRNGGGNTIVISSVGTPAANPGSFTAFPTSKGTAAPSTTTLCMAWGGRLRRTSGTSC